MDPDDDDEENAYPLCSVNRPTAFLFKAVWFIVQHCSSSTEEVSRLD